MASLEMPSIKHLSPQSAYALKLNKSSKPWDCAVVTRGQALAGNGHSNVSCDALS
jgi:hypothetical protein